MMQTRLHLFCRLDALAAGYFFQLRHVPDFDRVIAAAGDQPFAVRAEGQAADEAGVAAEGADQVAGLAVPDPHRTVLPRRRQPPAVGAEGHRVDVPAVSPESPQLPARLHVPDL